MNLNQVTVPTHDVPASVAFYAGLGLRLIVSSAHYARFECPDGDATFSVHHTEGPLPGSPIVVYFECADLDQQVLALKERGYRFESDPADQPWLWREARLRDPAGNAVCLYRAGDNRKHPPWRVKA
ncbi:MAG: VOC family protein [Rubrivivax sp.]|nr:VOC family protein [Rubrivivax sp.]